MVAIRNSSCPTDRLLDLKFALAESEIRQQFRLMTHEEMQLRLLARRTKIEDKRLLQKILDAGLTVETAFALELFPIAMIAWASGSVTPAERRFAEAALQRADFACNQQTAAVFKGWLNRRPSDSLWPLWEEYVSAILADLHCGDCEENGHAIWRTARLVAAASGGVFGIGSICQAEQAVLDRIQVVYGIES